MWLCVCDVSAQNMVVYADNCHFLAGSNVNPALTGYLEHPNIFPACIKCCTAQFCISYFCTGDSVFLCFSGLSGKRRTVTAAEMEEFKKQAECLNLPQPLVSNPEGGMFVPLSCYKRYWRKTVQIVQPHSQPGMKLRSHNSSSNFVIVVTKQNHVRLTGMCIH